MRIQEICCIGAGFVGGPTMAVIAHECPEVRVTVVDTNIEKIKAWNSPNLDKLPVYEPGLKDLVRKTRNKNLFFSTDIDNAIIKAQMIFLAVNTPTKKDGEGKGYAADLTNIVKCSKRIAKVSRDSKIIVEKSTLPVRTAERIKQVLKSNSTEITFEVLSNPEFLAEGTAIQDLYKSDRVLIGSDNTKRGREALNSLISLYEKWIPKSKILKTSVWSAELSKLASNAMLAQRISSINSLSALCEKSGASIEEVSKAIGMDKRIGSHFLNVSPGFGGSCFQKDILNLVYLCRNYGLHEVANYWEWVVRINDYQKSRFSNKVMKYFGNKIINKRITILGWSFKKNTNDSRESASIYICRDLLIKGATIHIYDPMVPPKRIISDIEYLLESNNFEQESLKELISKVYVSKNINDAVKSTEAILILTEWDEFKRYDWKKFIQRSKINVHLFDSRNIVDKSFAQNLYSIGN
ncbi:nucleotide sugar dehydrogenase [bacterium]|nr:nucleotide sugar dehydrogenase [Bacteroidota bacterium]MDC3064157.1 nucleotide sugar dehydrogenase [bacterium]